MKIKKKIVKIKNKIKEKKKMPKVNIDRILNERIVIK